MAIEAIIDPVMLLTEDHNKVRVAAGSRSPGNATGPISEGGALRRNSKAPPFSLNGDGLRAPAVLTGQFSRRFESDAETISLFYLVVGVCTGRLTSTDFSVAANRRRESRCYDAARKRVCANDQPAGLTTAQRSPRLHRSAAV